MSRDHTFDESLWERDIARLAPQHKALANRVLALVCGYLGGSVYHRKSKKENPSDRQTLINHPATRHVFLVVSVVPVDKTEHRYGLRLDFFDRDKAVTSDSFEIMDAPKTQWTEKGERRFFLPEEAPLDDLAMLIVAIWNRAR